MNWTTRMATRVKFRWVLPLCVAATLLALMYLGGPRVQAATSIVTGFINDSQGNPVYGTLTMQLPLPAQDTATNTAVAPVLQKFSVVDGVIQTGPPLYDVAGLQPKNLYYVAKVYDSSGALILSGNYVVTGSTFNFGAATPTTVTTSNISYVTPVTTSAANVFSALQTFNSSAVVNGNLSTQNVIPSTAGTSQIGIITNAYLNLFLGSSGSTNTQVSSAATAFRTMSIPDTNGTFETIIGSGSTPLNVAALGGAGCETTVSVGVPAATTASRIIWNYATDPSAVAGYGAAPVDAVHISAWPTASVVNFKQCSAVAVTPGAISILWNVVN